MAIEDLDLGKYQLGWSDAEQYVFKPAKGLSENVVKDISWWKGEPEWMTKFRLKSLQRFDRKPMAAWFADHIPNIDFDDIYYYIKPTEAVTDDWDQLPEQMRQTYEKLGIPEAEQRYFAGVTSQYECLRGDTRVWTSEGFIPIKDVEPGDVVFSLDEETNNLVTATVTAVACSGEKEVFEIKARGRVVGASANHPFLVLRDERKPGNQRARYAKRWIPVEELREGDLVAIATDVPEFGQPWLLSRPQRAAQFPLHSSVDLMWWIGVFLGDGYLKHSDGYETVEFAINNKDTVLVDEIIRVTHELFGIELRVAKDGLRLCGIGTAAIAEYLYFNGIGGNAHTKRVPLWAFTLPLDQRLALLAGFIDADGYVRNSVTCKNPSLTSANETLLNDARDLAQMCGIGVSRVSHFTSKHPFDADRLVDGYRLHFSGKFDRLPVRSPWRADRLNKRKYAHGYTSAKGTTFKTHCSDSIGFARVESITSVGVEPVYDITVAGHHNFVAEGFVVHNSEVVYHRNREDLEKQGIIFCDMDTALREYPELVKQYFGTVIPPGDNKFAALNSAVWSGGCLTESAMINVLGKGLVSIRDIEAGDEVFGADAGRNLVRGKVLAQVESGKKPVFRMRVAGRTLEATANHQFLVARRREVNGRVRWITEWDALENIAVGEPIAISRTLPDDGEPRYMAYPDEYTRNKRHQKVLFPHTTRPDVFWLLGLFLGDGHVATPAKNMRQTSFSVPKEDEAREPALHVLRSVFGIEHVTQVPCGFVVNSMEFGQWLEFNGFAGLAKTKRLPAWVHDLPAEERLSLIAGLIDADGWADNGGRTMSVELANRELLEDIRQLALSVGLRCDGALVERTRTATFRDGREVTATSWRLRISGDVHRLPIASPPKRGMAPSKGRASAYGAATGLNFGSLCTDTVGFALLNEKTPVGEAMTYDIQVVGLENFVANGIVAHNSFIYVPPGVNCELPLQAYFRINSENAGQFERTLIIADEGAQVHYIEGCSAPVYAKDSDSLHSAVVELIAMPHSRITYTTIQNWSNNVYNLVTKRARAEEGAHVEWIDGNIGSKRTIKYPSVYLMGPKASGEVLSVAYAGETQWQDTGAKMYHCAPETTSTIISKSISKDGGRTTYRGLVHVDPGAVKSKSFVRCDALLLDDDSISDTKPYMEVGERDAQIGHEATVSKIGTEQLFYLMSRGLSEEQAMGMIVNGFIEPITKTLPMEYAVEWSRLIELQMEGSIG